MQRVERMATTTAGNGIEFEQANYLQKELSSLGLECNIRNEFNDKEELQALTTAIKEVHFQEYKTLCLTVNTGTVPLQASSRDIY